MSIKVLVFESDSAFAGELRSGLGNLGCTVRVVDDGAVGLQQAQTARPDLILLSIELPRMNGFSVCNKLKKDADLKDIPLIIMSSESSEETFEQHKKLRTRAEAYVHKPVAFGDLRREIERFVGSLDGEPEVLSEDIGDGEVEVGIVIDDDPEIEVAAAEAGRPGSVRPSTPAAQRREVDPDVDAFADDAFGRLQALGDGPAPRAPSNLPPPPPARDGAGTSRARSVPPAPVRPPPEGEPVAAPSADEVTARAAELEQARSELEAAAGERDQAKALASQLEQQLRQAHEEAERARQEAEAESTRVKQELEELRTRSASIAPKRGTIPPKGGGVTSREFLDLRENLSKKDKEILALRQQLGAKDREIFEVRDKSLAHESRVSELDDALLAKDRELAEAAERIEGLGGQLESTKLGLADTQTALDRAEAQIEEARVQREQDGIAHQAAIAALKGDWEEAEKNLKAEHAAALERAQAAFKSDLEAARKEAADVQAASLAARAAEAEEHAAALAAQAAEAEERKTAALAAQAAEAEERKTAALAAQAAEAEEQKTAALAAQAAEAEERKTAALAAQAAEAEEQKAAALAAQAAEGEERKAAALAAQAAEAEEQKTAALAAQAAEAETRKAAAIAHRESELHAETDAKLASLYRAQQDELHRARAEATGRESQLNDEIGKLKARVEDLERQLGDASTLRGSLESQLGVAEGKAAALAEDLEGVRKELAREASRATRAVAKWDADRASLERAKDALAVALCQIDEAEARPISE
jgi:CheY-like chemotaxis protein